ncbi:hypothetical protein [Roseiconus lacunae]|uniref:hypothetical protein n=1 Tax=Roseiconus lacunae TaxID=2605694 RepID=UPI001E35F89C|nr:hypothetical protein [Roseiconus lacunae]
MPSGFQPSTLNLRAPVTTLGRMPTRLPLIWLLAFGLVGWIGGCGSEPEITTYTIPKNMPEELVPGKQRLLAVMVPRGSEAWFFKIQGPEEAVDGVAQPFKDFVQSIEFGESGQPILDSLPESWQLGGEKPMRFATVYINTAKKQLELTVSTLPINGDYPEYAAQNVNRWRNQVGLKPSDETWAGAEPLEMEVADKQALLADFVGEPTSGGGSMMPPMMGGSMMGGGAMTGDALAGGSAGKGGESSGQATETQSPKYDFETPEGWQEQEARGMRELSFVVGPEDATAEVTLITAGGDLRSNVARWMGQVIKGTPEDEAVDQMLTDAERFDVSGFEAQRFIIEGDAGLGQFSIDATIIPTEGNFSKFVKMTGPPKTVSEQRDAMKSFLQSLSF